MANNVKITATSEEEFRELKKALGSLHLKVRDGIESISKPYTNIVYTVKQSFTNPITINIPNDINNIDCSKTSVKISTKVGIFQAEIELKDKGFVIDVW